jgi:uncharacterized protein
MAIITRDNDMKESILEIVVCPVCKGTLELRVSEKKDSEIISGSLTCEKCSHAYPIADGIPNLLPPDVNC